MFLKHIKEHQTRSGSWFWKKAYKCSNKLCLKLWTNIRSTQVFNFRSALYYWVFLLWNRLSACTTYVIYAFFFPRKKEKWENEKSYKKYNGYRLGFPTGNQWKFQNQINQEISISPNNFIFQKCLRMLVSAWICRKKNQFLKVHFEKLTYSYLYCLKQFFNTTI